nr:sporulation protein YqfD [uncultured Ruminococcus sp.]
MLLKIIRFLRGNVDFTASGKFPERFINITAKNGVNIWNPVPAKNAISASMYLSDYKKIRTLAKKSRVKTKITAKHGMPFIVNRYKARTGLFAGAVFGIILCIFLSNFIWSVKISGTEEISNIYLESLLSDNGISVGVWKNNLDVDQIERNIQRKCGDVRWMSINITGSLVTVEVKETYKKPKLDTSKNPCNVKAVKDGVITRIQAYNGKPVVTKGSGVVNGQVLVSGLDETKQGDMRYLRANAKVFADITEQRTLSIPKKITYSTATDNYVDRKNLKFLWIDFPCNLAFESYENSVSTVHGENLFINDVVLPVGFKIQTDRELVTEDYTISKSSAQEIVKTDCILYEIFAKSESTVVSRNISVEENKSDYNFTADYIFNENIACQVNFDVTE